MDSAPSVAERSKYKHQLVYKHVCLQGLGTRNQVLCFALARATGRYAGCFCRREASFFLPTPWHSLSNPAAKPCSTVGSDPWHPLPMPADECSLFLLKLGSLQCRPTKYLKPDLARAVRLLGSSPLNSKVCFAIETCFVPLQ